MGRCFDLGRCARGPLEFEQIRADELAADGGASETMRKSPGAPTRVSSHAPNPARACFVQAPPTSSHLPEPVAMLAQ